MKFARELLCECVQEIHPLLLLHYEEITLHKERTKLSPNWAEYTLMEQLDRLVIFSARTDAGELVGYNLFFVHGHHHYADIRYAINDVFFLTKEHRRGTATLRFLRFCEHELRAIGVNKLIYNCKLKNNLAPILRRMGYGDEEVVVAKLF